MVQLQNLKLSDNVTVPSDLSGLSVTLSNTDTALNNKIDNLSSDLSNYWKISKDEKDPTKVVSQEMDYLVMKDQVNGIGRYMYVKQNDEEEAVWFCDYTKNRIPAGTTTVSTTAGTKCTSMKVK